MYQFNYRISQILNTIIISKSFGKTTEWSLKIKYINTKVYVSINSMMFNIFYDLLLKLLTDPEI